MRTVANHRGMAKARLIESWVVGVKVYGKRPRRFMLRRKTIRDDRRKAHLWPGVLRGKKICFVKALRNHVWNRVGRLVASIFDGVVTISHGVKMAIVMRGILNRVGEANWSNRLFIMFSVRY